MNLETELRHSLREHATDAPVGEGISVRARRLAGRRRTARWIAAGVAAVLVGVPGAVIAPDLVRTALDGAPVAERPPVTLDALPEFPYRPGWRPAGLADPYVTLEPAYGVDGHEAGMLLQLVHAHVGDAGEEREPAPLTLSALPYDPLGAGFNPVTRQHSSLTVQESEPTSVQGRPATLVRLSGRSGGWAVSWQAAPDQWLLGYAGDEVGRSALERYVADLAAEPLPVTVPVTLAAVPPGAEVRFVAPDLLLLHAPAAPPTTLRLQVTVSRADQLDEEWLASFRSETTVAVAGGSATLLEARSGDRALIVPAGPDLVVIVNDNLTGPGLTYDGLLEFAAGISVTPEARQLLESTP